MNVIDTHIHYGTDANVASATCTPYMITGKPETVIRYLDEQNASHGVLFPHDRVMSPPWDADYDNANTLVGEAVKRYPGRLIGAARINPAFGAEHTTKLIDRYVKEWNCRGLKLVAGYDFYRPNDMRVMGPLMEKAEEYGLTVLFHSGDAPRDLPALQAVAAKKFPGVKVVLAHIGMHLYLWEAIIAAQENENLYVDMAQAFPYDIKIFINQVSAARLMYGSDAPYQSAAVEQLKLREIGLSDIQLNAVFRENAIKVWGIR
ncbi:MAG: amidohydrolase family protein [Spirochaetaceae bacterium]|jgi:predicted TIM-barrel fold metal-dependent hydrolase|nr:amidohydrolase family protein [Spirochaetaceae bacterium]